MKRYMGLMVAAVALVSAACGDDGPTGPGTAMGPPELTVTVSPAVPGESFGEDAARWGIRLTNDVGSTWNLTCPEGGGVGVDACDGNSGEAKFRIYPPEGAGGTAEIQVWPVTLEGGSLGYAPCKGTVSGSTASITIPANGCEAM